MAPPWMRSATANRSPVLHPWRASHPSHPLAIIRITPNPVQLSPTARRRRPTGAAQLAGGVASRKQQMALIVPATRRQSRSSMTTRTKVRPVQSPISNTFILTTVQHSVCVRVCGCTWRKCSSHQSVVIFLTF